MLYHNFIKKLQSDYDRTNNTEKIYFQKLYDRVAEFIKNTDEYKKEEQAKPTIEVFMIKEQHTDNTYFIDYDDKLVELDSIPYFILESSTFHKDYIVVEYEKELIEKGYYANEGNWARDKYKFVLHICAKESWLDNGGIVDDNTTDL